MADTTDRGRYPLVSEEEWKRALDNAAPTRPDDTVVIEGGRRATFEEVQALIARDLERRRQAAADPDG